MQYRNNINLTWVNGRKLASFTKNGATTTFTYDGDGNRIQKVSGNTTIDYIVIGGTIYGEIRTENGVATTLHYLFDENGNRIGFVVNGTDTYYYRFNLQGDVTGIYNSAGDLVVEYTYDTWGKPNAPTGDANIANLNPIRYRGYYYDVETGLYYLQSRYYDPETGRFINADGVIAAVDDSVQGYNQFAYCFNNPINMEDETGHWPTWSDVKKWAKKNIVEPVKKFVKDVVEYVCNTDEQVVLESNSISFYKGVPVVRTPSFVRSGSFGIIFLSTDTNDSTLSPGDIVRHEYGHTRQLKELGVMNYAITVGIPSFFDLGEKWGNDEYYNKPWEVMANVYGGVEEYKNSQNDINAAYKYHRGSQKVGPLILVFIEQERSVYEYKEIYNFASCFGSFDCFTDSIVFRHCSVDFST